MFQHSSVKSQGFVTIQMLSLTNNWIVTVFWDLGESGVRSRVWVLTIGVLEVNPELDSIRGRAKRAF